MWREGVCGGEGVCVEGGGVWRGGCVCGRRGVWRGGCVCREGVCGGEGVCVERRAFVWSVCMEGGCVCVERRVCVLDGVVGVRVEDIEGGCVEDVEDVWRWKVCVWRMCIYVTFPCTDYVGSTLTQGFYNLGTPLTMYS